MRDLIEGLIYVVGLWLFLATAIGVGVRAALNSPVRIAGELKVATPLRVKVEAEKGTEESD